MSLTHCIGYFVMLVSVAEQAETVPATAEHYSASRAFVLRISLDPQQPARPGWCLAELYSNRDTQRVQVWKRYLINDTAPNCRHLLPRRLRRWGCTDAARR